MAGNAVRLKDATGDWIDLAYVSTVEGASGDKAFVYTQGAPSATWDVSHGLGKFPAVDVVDTGGSTVMPDVLYIDPNNVRLTFGSPTSGKAYLN